MFFLNEVQQQSLLLQPETGLGYQLVEVTTLAGRRAVGVAFNAELVLERDEPSAPLLFRAYTRGHPVQANGAPVGEVRILPRGSADHAALMVGEARAAYATPGIAAQDAPVAVTGAGEVFTRFSACAIDRRVRTDGSLAPGSFATTATDARQAGLAREILARYALPHPGPIVHHFTLRPAVPTLIQYGTAQPAFAQPGGGVEVFFTEGTTLRTVTGPEKIPVKGKPET